MKIAEQKTSLSRKVSQICIQFSKKMTLNVVKDTNLKTLGQFMATFTIANFLLSFISSFDCFS